MVSGYGFASDAEMGDDLDFAVPIDDFRAGHVAPGARFGIFLSGFRSYWVEGSRRRAYWP